MKLQKFTFPFVFPSIANWSISKISVLSLLPSQSCFHLFILGIYTIRWLKMAMYILQQIMAILPGIGKTQINRRNEPWRQGRNSCGCCVLYFYICPASSASSTEQHDGWGDEMTSWNSSFFALKHKGSVSFGMTAFFVHWNQAFKWSEMIKPVS